jgi:isoquinoline 1-oxidoreductase beta subunit
MNPQMPDVKRQAEGRAMNDVAARENTFRLDRRDFLRNGAAGLVVCFTLGVAAGGARAGTATMLGAYIQIASDNTVTVYIGASEMGQGIMTGLAQLVAEELMLDWTMVQAAHAPAAAAYANPLFHFQVTGGSTSMRGWFQPLRQAAAVARQMLIAAGEIYLGSQTGTGTAKNGAVWCGSSSVPYSQIVAAAAGLTPPDPKTVPLISNLQVIGKPMARTDIPAKVKGAAIYGIDVRLPGMVYATVVHCPTLGGTVKTMPATPAGALALVRLNNAVGLTNAVGVVASNTWQAMQIASQLNIQWSIPSASLGINSSAILSTAQNLLTTGTAQIVETSGSPDNALTDPATLYKIDATYQLPYLAHACMEVMNCTVTVTSTSCDIWAPTQGQALCVSTAKQLLGLTDAQITVHTTFLGGGLGRKFEQDFVSQAIQIAKAIGKPVKLTWPREQDFKNDMYRPCALIRVQAGLDKNANFASLIYRNVAPSISMQRGGTSDPGAVEGATGLTYAIANRRIEFVQNPAAVPVGYWRSVGNSYNVFAVESAVDELALAANLDPMAFRHNLLANNPRGQAVLDAVAQIGNWTIKPPSGSARGVAFAICMGSIVAQVAEISLNSDGTIRVNKMSCAIDCGTAVNPDSVEAQMQSGIVHGLSATLWGQVTFTSGSPNVSNFSTYRMLRMSEMPMVTVQIVNSGGPIGGVGEPGVPCVAPAVANAYAKLTGKRVRTLPFFPGAKMGGL